jgi:hypothetical protein
MGTFVNGWHSLHTVCQAGTIRLCTLVSDRQIHACYHFVLARHGADVIMKPNVNTAKAQARAAITCVAQHRFISVPSPNKHNVESFNSQASAAAAADSTPSRTRSLMTETF